MQAICFLGAGTSTSSVQGNVTQSSCDFLGISQGRLLYDRSTGVARGQHNKQTPMTARLASISFLAIVASLAAPNAQAEEFTGVMSCGELQNSPQSRSREPFTGTVTMRIAGGRAFVERRTQRVLEQMEGSVNWGQPIQLSGKGAFLDAPERFWRTRATLVRRGDHYGGTGALESQDGTRKFRDCTFAFTIPKTASGPSKQVASAEQKTSPATAKLPEQKRSAQSSKEVGAGSVGANVQTKGPQLVTGETKTERESVSSEASAVTSGSGLPVESSQPTSKTNAPESPQVAQTIPQDRPQEPSPITERTTAKVSTNQSRPTSPEASEVSFGLSSLLLAGLVGAIAAGIAFTLISRRRDADQGALNNRSRETTGIVYSVGKRLANVLKPSGGASEGQPLESPVQRIRPVVGARRWWIDVRKYAKIIVGLFVAALAYNLYTGKINVNGKLGDAFRGVSEKFSSDLNNILSTTNASDGKFSSNIDVSNKTDADVQSLVSLGHSMQGQGRLKDAESAYLVAAKTAKKLHGTESIQYVQVVEHLVTMYGLACGLSHITNKSGQSSEDRAVCETSDRLFRYIIDVYDKIIGLGSQEANSARDFYASYLETLDKKSAAAEIRGKIVSTPNGAASKVASTVAATNPPTISVEAPSRLTNSKVLGEWSCRSGDLLLSETDAIVKFDTDNSMSRQLGVINLRFTDDGKVVNTFDDQSNWIGNWAEDQFGDGNKRAYRVRWNGAQFWAIQIASQGFPVSEGRVFGGTLLCGRTK